MHDSRVGSELGQFSRDAVIKTGSNSQNDVSLSHGAVCREGPMHTEHTYPQRIITGESPQPHQRGTDRSVHEVGQCAEFLCGIGHDHAATTTISGFLEVTRTSIARRSWFRLARNVGQYDRITTSSGQTNSQLAC